jgi:predicted Zn finger-like uncharacterized protein
VDKVSFVTCPECKGEYYVERSDYLGKPDGLCHCPFCAHEFPISRGNARPPVVESAAH